MSDVTVKRIEEMDKYEGEHAIEGVAFRYAGRNLGVSAWGMNVIELAPSCTRYPEHDHEKDEQEEVYVVLRGSATLHAGVDEWTLEAGAFARVGPLQMRKLVAGPDGATILALGGTPGKAYEARR